MVLSSSFDNIIVLCGKILLSLWSLLVCMGISFDVKTFSLTSSLESSLGNAICYVVEFYRHYSPSRVAWKLV